MTSRRAAWRQAVADFAEAAENNPMAIRYLGGLVSPSLVRNYYAVREDGADAFGTPQPTPEQAAKMAREINERLGTSLKSPEGYDTNLAAEFHILSLLHRLGFTANLTLGNKKSVDVVVVSRTGQLCSLDVKGLAGATGWPIDNARESTANHFYAFVCYNNLIGSPWESPEVYVVPAEQLRSLRYTAPGGRKLMRVSTLREQAHSFEHAWHLLDGPSA